MKKNMLHLLVIIGLVIIFLAGCLKKNGESEMTSVINAGEAIDASGSAVLTKPIEVICPWAAGGSADTNARRIGQVVGQMIGQAVTVSNQTGGGGAVGFTAQMNATPDGFTLGIITAELNTLPPQGLITFTQADLYPIIRMNTLPACIAVPVDTPYDSLEELISYAKEHPDELRTGNVGIGSIWHICAAKLEAATGISLVHFPYDGASSAVAALLGGELDLVTLETSVCNQYVESGDLKILGVMAEERLVSFPDYPTCKELGYNIVAGSYQGIVCPVDVPDEVKEELERVFTDAYHSDAYQNFCEEYGLEKSYLNSADFRTFLEEDLEGITEVMKDLGLANGSHREKYRNLRNK